MPFPPKLKMGKTTKNKETPRMYIQKDTRYYEHCSTKIITTGTTSSVPFAEMRPSDPNHQSNGLKPAPRARRAARGACCALAARRVGNPSASHAVSGGDLWASVEDRLATRGIILGQVRAQSRLNLLRLATRRGCSRGQNRACIALRDVLVLHIICACAPHRKRRAHSRQAPPV